MSPLTDSARSGGGAYSGRMTEQSLTVQRSCRLEHGSAPESVAIRDLIRDRTLKKISGGGLTFGPPQYLYHGYAPVYIYIYIKTLRHLW